MNLLCQLIDGSVGGSTDKDGAAMEPDQLVDDGGRGDRLTGPGRALDQGQRPLQRMLHSIHLHKILPLYSHSCVRKQDLILFL